MTVGKITKFTNCRILKNHKITEGDLWVENGIFVDPQDTFYNRKKTFDTVVNMNGLLIAPGFIDIQINGGFGIDFTHDLSIKGKTGLDFVAKNLLKHGVTSFCPTLVSSKPEVYKTTLPVINIQNGSEHGAGILGVHLEGPFINREKHGAHDVKNLRNFDKGVESLKIYGNLENTKVITLAPELSNSCEVIKYLSSQNIIVSIGHSAASYTIGENAILCGATLVTHLFNAMHAFHHRDPGLLGLLGHKSKRDIYYGVIADGVHSHDSALAIAYRAHPSGAILVTDAIAAMGLGEGLHLLGNKTVQVKDGRAYISGTTTLAGSIATMNECIKIFKNAIGCTTEEALEAASLHPALALGISNKKGSLNYNCDADFVALDDELNVRSTWIGGICVATN